MRALKTLKIALVLFLGVAVGGIATSAVSLAMLPLALMANLKIYLGDV